MVVAERRKEPRGQILYYLKVYDNETQGLLGYVEDIAPHGFMLRAKHQLEAKDSFFLKFLLPMVVSEEDREIECEAVQIWDRYDVNQECFFYGFAISQISEPYFARIQELIQEYGFKNY